MDKATWKDMERLKVMLSSLRSDPKKDWTDGTIKTWIGNLQYRLNAFRSELRGIEEHTPAAILEKSKIIDAVKTTVQTYKARTKWTIHVGGQPSANKQKARKSGWHGGSWDSGDPGITIRVGYMWLHKVYKPLYSNMNLDATTWLVLQAEEVRVNERNIRLYQGLAFNRTTGETKEVWIGQSRHEKQKAELAFTMRSAIDAAKQIVADDIGKKFTGESDNE